VEVEESDRKNYQAAGISAEILMWNPINKTPDL
jgi:hypothetical protein